MFKMTKPNKILVAYDGSSQSKKALEWAIDLSRNSNGKVIVAFVAEPVHRTPVYGIEVGSEQNIVDALKEVEGRELIILEDAKNFCISRGVDVKTELLYGNIAQTIINYAKSESADLIIAGTKGHGAVEGLLMGSVTGKLVSLAHIPVLVVKD
jgi:nucleotide-binding universal stress UspA family protein